MRGRAVLFARELLVMWRYKLYGCDARAMQAVPRDSLSRWVKNYRSYARDARPKSALKSTRVLKPKRQCRHGPDTFGGPPAAPPSGSGRTPNNSRYSTKFNKKKLEVWCYGGLLLVKLGGSVEVRAGVLSVIKLRSEDSKLFQPRGGDAPRGGRFNHGSQNLIATFCLTRRPFESRYVEGGWLYKGLSFQARHRHRSMTDDPIG
jgi:hypothetical protein